MRRRQIIRIIVGLVILAIVAGVTGLLVLRSDNEPVFLAEGDLKDGRILRVEGLTYGKEHYIGHESTLLTRLRRSMPGPLNKLFRPGIPLSHISRSNPGLVVWVHAIDSVGGTNVDCQGVRLEFVSDEGDLFGASDLYWYGYTGFWRVGHAFDAFPRQEKSLTLRMTSWKSEETAEVQLINPWHTEGEEWTGARPPAREEVDDYEIVLAGLNPVSAEEEYYRTPSTWLEPKLELWHAGHQETNGWSHQWIAEDPFGNRGQKLGMHQPVLKYSVTFHPSATNLEAALLLTNSPPFALDLQTVNWWEIPAQAGIHSLVMLGVFPPGMHAFSAKGEYLTNPPVTLTPVQGGPPSGWVTTSRQLTPLHQEILAGHYTDVPTIYVRVLGRALTERIGIRLRDDNGRVWLAEPEGQQSSADVLPFLIRLPEVEVESLSAELVHLPALEAEFLIATGAPENQFRTNTPSLN